MSLRTDYTNDIWEGKRKYLLIDNGDGTYSLDDVTNYVVIGDIFNADDINDTNKSINQNTQGLVEERELTDQQISAERKERTQQIESINRKIESERTTTNRQIESERTTTNRQIESERTTTNEQIQNVKQSISSLDTALTKVQTVTFTIGGWSAAAPYTQQISVSGMTSAQNPIPGLIYPSNMTAEQKENIDKSSDMITDLETFNGYIKATCKFKKPISDITIGLKGR